MNEKLQSKWAIEPFPKSIEPVRAERSKQIHKNAYLQKGKYPIVDQGQELIAGWTDDETTLIKDNLPLIIFGDHTRIFKYIDFPFAIGADGTKLIKPIKKFNPRYFYYYLLNLDIPSKGYNRHFKLLKEKDILYPPLPEQEKVATVLFKIQKAIETQEKIINTLQELKKSTMEYLFTHGTKGEKTKQTEIGEIPESWEPGKLDDICTLITNTCSPNECSDEIYVGLEHIESGRFKISTFGSPKEVRSSKYQYNINDVLYGKLRPYLDKTIIAEQNGICSTDILVFRPNKNVPSWFLASILHLKAFINYAIQTTHGVNHPRTSWKSLKEYAIGIPHPEEQYEIAHLIECIERKNELNNQKRITLTNLFNSILNKLMTGEIRVNNLDTDVSEVDS